IHVPVVAVGCSPEHVDFPGTLTLRESTLEALLVDVLTSLRRHGFERAFVFSAHGGNFALLVESRSRLREAASPMRVGAFTDLTALTARLQRESVSLGVSPEAAGHHAGEIETSILLAIAPEGVRRAALAPGRLEPAADGQSLFYPSLRPNAPNGTVGDPRPADAARGERYLEAWVGLLVEACRREFE
ncbi:MAG: creatininase family protein, partial [Candidatus Binatia bacterium]